MKIDIYPMKIDMLEEVAQLDARCFKRADNLRTVQNLRTMFETYPEGCFIYTGSQGIVAYIFGHRFGTVGYIGPLGVDPEYRKLGIGKQIISRGIEALVNSGCTSVGLEMLPESGYNVGLYLKSKFILTYPTVMLTKQTMETGVEPDFNDKVLDGSNGYPSGLEEFDSSFGRFNMGYSFLHDIQWAISTSPKNIYFYIDEDKIKGFLSYNPDLYPFVWGALLPSGNVEEVFNSLFTAIEHANPGKELKIRINTRYTQLYRVIGSGFTVDRSFTRMMLEGYEGSFLTLESNLLVCRAWMG